MDVMDKPKAAEIPAPPAPRGLAALLAELQALSVMLPVAERSDADFEAEVDNLPV